MWCCCNPMCECALSCAREHLLPLATKHLLPLVLDHLLPILNEFVNMIRGIPNTEMRKVLETIEKAIHDADEIADAKEANPSDETREKIKQLIEASFHIQDLIDEYIIREEQQQLPDPGCVDGASDYVKTKF
ncbi:LRR and NB-ARC domain disease resistance protein, partial [Trifolium medium]|nr:LRR and NB-ARC domain disease resistance protein [Trifolium medium]